MHYDHAVPANAHYTIIFDHDLGELKNIIEGNFGWGGMRANRVCIHTYLP